MSNIQDIGEPSRASKREALIQEMLSNTGKPKSPNNGQVSTREIPEGSPQVATGNSETTTAKKTTASASVMNIVSDMLKSNSLTLVSNSNEAAGVLQDQLISNASVASAIAAPKMPANQSAGVNFPFSNMSAQEVKTLSAQAKTMIGNASAASTAVASSAKEAIENSGSVAGMMPVIDVSMANDAEMMAKLQSLLLRVMALMSEMSQASRESRSKESQVSLKLGMKASDEMMKQSGQILSGMIASTVVAVAGIATSAAAMGKSSMDFAKGIKAQKKINTLVDNTPDAMKLVAVKTGSEATQGASSINLAGEKKLDFKAERAALKVEADELGAKAQTLSSVSNFAMQGMSTINGLVSATIESKNKSSESVKAAAEAMKQYIDVQVSTDSERVQKQQSAFDSMLRMYSDITDGYNRAGKLQG